ncbi:hypothetical protein QJS04_geneDACA007191 [Acorus gramineus]|uniref:Uncharacterized protein n=1 Tax=Acorus gramineus TaxID=55184 RepID=A0AAV9BQQ0_ACOGR|nr:hypothetical protein QJS04_geneDACA007191 [Acorus gramineus]
MQSRILSTSLRLLSSAPRTRSPAFVRATTSTSGPIFTESQDEQADRPPAEEDQHHHEHHKQPNKDFTVEDKRPKSSFMSPPKLETTETSSPNPTFQQKRHCHHDHHDELEEASCVGWDGRPLTGGGDNAWEDKWVEDDKDYFKDRKPSMLSEVEFKDTRFPASQNLDSTAARAMDGSQIGWREEQLESEDDALARAEAIFREVARKGIPDWPQSKVLRSKAVH